MPSVVCVISTFHLAQSSRHPHGAVIISLTLQMANLSLSPLTLGPQLESEEPKFESSFNSSA